ncbi:MAG: hypothetical protein J5777_03755, partial [Clostridiales bacterium]|nr:hypothetical protein [Clostridiales bacterium]
WSLVDVIPDYAKYSKIIANINKANDIIENETKAASANEAKIIFKTTQMECNRINDHVAAELNRICDEGIKRADQFSNYIKGKYNYDHKSFRSAINDLSKVPGYRDADEIIEKCKIEIEAERRRQLPWSVVFSLIIPAAVGLFLRETFGCPWIVCILLFLAGSAGLGYVLYRGGVVSVIIKVVSFLCATPLIVYSILAYALHVPTVLAVIIAIVGPIVLFILFASFTEQITKKNK